MTSAEMTVSERIDEFIRVEGKGNIRDALNVALARIEQLELGIVHPRPHCCDCGLQEPDNSIGNCDDCGNAVCHDCGTLLCSKCASVYDFTNLFTRFAKRHVKVSRKNE